MRIEISKMTCLALTIVLSALLAAGCGKEAEHAHKEPGAAKSAEAKREQGHEEHAEKKDRDDHDEHVEDDHDERGEDDQEEHDEEQVVRLSPVELKEFGIELDTAASGALDQYIDLPGEIVLNADRLAHVVPRVSGIVRQVFANEGDKVRAGQVLATLESRELADVKAEFLAARERLGLAQANFEREERLYQKKVSSEQDYLDARQALAEARIAQNSAEQKLRALGFTDSYLKDLPQHPGVTFTRFEIRAPFAGTVIEKHITLGETLKDDAQAFTVSDLSTVWVDINVYQKDLAQIRESQTVVVEVGHGIPSATGKIAWVSPLVGEATRTAKARVLLPNADGNLRPGLFVTAKVAVAKAQVDVRVPRTALQTLEDLTVVFVQEEEGFEPRPVKIGRESASHVEVVAGLEPGESYVSRGAFTLKAQLSKGAFGDGHAH